VYDRRQILVEHILGVRKKQITGTIALADHDI
jgi:hypothetical protein